MSLQIKGSLEKSVTFRAAKRLEIWINFVRVAFVVVVSQQSHNIFVFLYTSSSKCTDNVAIHKIDIIQQNVGVSRSSTKRSSFIWTLWVDRHSIHPFHRWINWKFQMFLLPVVDFRSNGEQDHKKDTSCRYRVTLCFLHTWDSWLYKFSEVVRVRLRPCTP